MKFIDKKDIFWEEKLAIKILFSLWIIYTVWLVAKIFGYINTPYILQNLPSIAGNIAIITFVWGAAKFVHKFYDFIDQLKRNTSDIGDIKVDIGVVKRSINKLEAKVF